MVTRFCLWLTLLALAGCVDESGPPQAQTPPADVASPAAASADTAPAQSPSTSPSGQDTTLALTGQIIDLTHPFDEQTIYWPTADGFKLERLKYGITEKGYFYASNQFAAAEHGGTHIDAPIHFAQGQKTVDQIPLERLIGEGAVVDVRQQCAADRDYQISVADLRNWEEANQQTLAQRIVLLHTGYSQYWPDRAKYLGTAQRGQDAVAQLHFPGLHPDAARWLAEQRAIRAVGIDTASIDYGQSTLFESHITLFEHEVPALENVAALDQLPPQFTVIALPMKIAGGSGGPLRIVAIGRP
jgi:kynurenine formamidase